MDDRTRHFLRTPSPVVDPDRAIDRFASRANLSLKGGYFEMRLDSGALLFGLASTPGHGIVRVRLRPDPYLPPSPARSPMLLDTLRDEPVDPSIVVHDKGLGLAPLELSDTLIGGLRDNGFVLVGQLGPHERIYGGGESFSGPNLRGRLRHLVNCEIHGLSGLDMVYINVPFIWSDAGWGILVHTGAPIVVDAGSAQSEVLALGVDGDELDVFFLQGSPRELIAQYHALTGLPGKFPSWALGVWTSRCSYLNAGEINRVIDEYERNECPVDVVHVDAWLAGNVIKDLACSWDIDRDRFPDGWARALAERGVKTSLWHNPYTIEGTKSGDELAARNLILRDADGKIVGTNDMPERRVLDFTSPEAEQWWRDHIRERTAAEGNVSWKPDFAEEVPPTAVTADGRTGWEIRNEYALRYQRATHDALIDELGTDEIALFCRSGTAGSQRYPCHWVGDTPSTWTGFVNAVRACLSLSLSGFGFVTSDAGGFLAPGQLGRTSRAFENMDPDEFIADVDPELYVRWTQFGALSPVMRFHGAGRREPFAYPQPYAAAAIAACRLRASLRPELERSSQQASTDGTPMMRPMALAFAEDPAAITAELQYMLGDDLLVAPVVERGGRARVYIPSGHWEPIAGLQPVDGPQWLTLDNVALDAIPAWRRA